MSDQFVGEIRLFGFPYAPLGWALCNGQTMSISQNAALFAVLGTSYGGDGRTTFNLPDLQDRAPMHWGNGANLTPRVIGEPLGSATVTVSQAEMPVHSHSIQARTASTGTQTRSEPSAGAWFGSSGPTGKAYNATATNSLPFSAKGVSPSGGSAPHPNAQPLLGLNFCIALEGVFPPHDTGPQ
jgi:microcystin-dependent protein